MQDALTFVTDFADQAVVLPLLTAVAVVLMMQRRWRLGMAWVVAVCGVLGTILVLKVVFYACGWLLPWFGEQQLALTSPSGHTASAVVEYGGLLTLLAARPGLAVRESLRWAVPAGLLIGSIIGFTRVQLGAHSLSEVVVAALIGVCGTIGFVLLAGPGITGRSVVPLAVAALLVIVVAHGRHFPAEGFIQHNAAAVLRSYVPVCEPKPAGCKHEAFAQ